LQDQRVTALQGIKIQKISPDININKVKYGKFDTTIRQKWQWENGNHIWYTNTSHQL